MFILGFDVGGTKVEAALFELSSSSAGQDAFPCQIGQTKVFGRCVGRARTPTERTKGYAHIIKEMVQLGLQVLENSGVKMSALNGLGVGLPGAVDAKHKSMLNGNTLVLVGRPIATDLAEGLGFAKDVEVENDANCFALAEHYCGAGLAVAENMGSSPSNVSGVGIILGTGCGGGFVLSGQLFSGAQGGAAEVGHTVLHRGGHACYCGQRGCAEQYLSGTAIEAHYSARRYSQVQNIQSAKDIFEQASRGEPLAVAVIKAYRDDLSSFLAGLTNTLNPHYFVLGGGVSLQDMIYEGLEELTLGKAFLPLKKLPIHRNQLGDSAGVLGAALLPLLRQNIPIH